MWYTSLLSLFIPFKLHFHFKGANIIALGFAWPKQQMSGVGLVFPTLKMFITTISLILTVTLDSLEYLKKCFFSFSCLEIGKRITSFFS